MALKSKKIPCILDVTELTMLKRLLLTEHQAPVQPDALRPHSATFLLSNSPARFRSPLLFQARTTSCPPAEAATVQRNPLQQEALPRPCLDLAAGRGTPSTALDGHTSPLENPAALRGKNSNYQDGRGFFFPLPPCFFSLPSYFSLLISHKSESIFQFPF